MARKNITWKTRGMNRDLSVSAFNAEFAFENINLRLSTNEKNTMMSWVNERGTKEMALEIEDKTGKAEDEDSKTVVEGYPIGTAVLNHQLVVFTTNDRGEDRIYKFIKAGESKLNGELLFRGELGFSQEKPLETLVSYESENIQKVYWTDNENQPRVINIANPNIQDYTNSSFDFVPELQLQEEVKVTKMFGAGEFPAGVIQYAFTYYNKYGQESNVFYTTPLQYISYIDRGGSPDSKIANSFKIEISNVDKRFDYLRIYSLLRTSKDSVPTTKRVQDIEINEQSTLTFIDNGSQGDSIDPTELLYKGGEEILAETMEQKDGTLFLGNLKIKRPQLDIQGEIWEANGINRINTAEELGKDNRNYLANSNIKSVHGAMRPFMRFVNGTFVYLNTLSAPEGYNYEGASGFKSREYYRLGVQFQYKNGKWSEPFWIGDKQEEKLPIIEEIQESVEGKLGGIAFPEFTYNLNITDIFEKLYSAGYRRIRPVYAVPRLSDRTVLCQGVGCPTVYKPIDREEEKLYSQASWLFRVPSGKYSADNREEIAAEQGGGWVSYVGRLKSQYEEPVKAIDQEGTSYKVSPYLRSTEIMGTFDAAHSFNVDNNVATIHSPELVFDTAFHFMDFKGDKMRYVGSIPLTNTFGDIDIQVSTPTIGSDAAGFVHRSIKTDGSAALITAPFFNDYIVKDIDGDKYEAYNSLNSVPVDYPIYMWHKNGSLNNDVSREGRSAQLLKKRISNYRVGGTTKYYDTIKDYSIQDVQLFDSTELSAVKVDGKLYMGNIETMLVPTEPSPFYLIGNPWRKKTDTDFNSESHYRLSLEDMADSTSTRGIWGWRWVEGVWKWAQNDNDYKDIGKKVNGLVKWREPVSMKYKSTPHIVAKLSESVFPTDNYPLDNLPLVELYKEYNMNTLYGGASDDALQALTWISCGPVESFTASDKEKTIKFRWGDTYIQRYECLKTYPYTTEDKNQVVEIASFVCETRVNIDGRYDRNRAQVSNLNMSPQNFNLLNPVYSQMDNFFSYKILDEDTYKNVDYPNNITWTKTKESGADIDLWTNITMANTMEMDGDKGSVRKLTRLNNQLLAFQDRGISQILYNENTQISTTEGVPIEIANSQKVQGKRYYSDTIGCSNKWSLVQTPTGIYFMDSNDKSIYRFNGELANITTSKGLNAWAKQNIPSSEEEWDPWNYNNFRAFYDKKNQDVLFVNKETALAYSEKFDCFTSFYDYGNAPFFNSLDDTGIWITGDETMHSKIWEHQAGEYSQFFGENKPFSMTLIANQEPQMDKIFTNMDFRACTEGEGTYNEKEGSFTPTLPFDTLETWDEYQHGILKLSIRNGKGRYEHGKTEGMLSRKYRIWKCDIPRDNVLLTEAEIKAEEKMGIKRYKERPLDRMRNPWIYIKLKKEAAEPESHHAKTEVHDIEVSYFN